MQGCAVPNPTTTFFAQWPCPFFYPTITQQPGQCKRFYDFFPPRSAISTSLTDTILSLFFDFYLTLFSSAYRLHLHEKRQTQLTPSQFFIPKSSAKNLTIARFFSRHGFLACYFSMQLLCIANAGSIEFLSATRPIFSKTARLFITAFNALI